MVLYLNNFFYKRLSGDYMNELKNIINLFNDCDLEIYTNVDYNYIETDCASLQCICEFVNLGNMIHPDYTWYVNYEEDHVIFDIRGQEYLGYWR